MNIRYTGKRKVRVVGPYQWDAGNGFVQEVKEQDLIDDLLTEPSNEFEDAGKVTPAKPKKKWWNEAMPASTPERVSDSAKPHAEHGNQEEA